VGGDAGGCCATVGRGLPSAVKLELRRCGSEPARLLLGGFAQDILRRDDLDRDRFSGDRAERMHVGEQQEQRQQRQMCERRCRHIRRYELPQVHRTNTIDVVPELRSDGDRNGALILI
jgi:hypothetical protein